MMQSPQSLTAVIHVKFNYTEPQPKPITESDIELVSRILGQASDLSPDLQEILVQFADYLKQHAGVEGQGP